MRHLLLACLLATLALTTSGCATVIFGLLGVAGCGGDTNCMGNAVSGGVAIDGAILQAAVESGSRRAADDARQGYVCSSPDQVHQFSARALPDARDACMTYGQRAWIEGECECVAASSVEPLAPPSAGGYAPPPPSYAVRVPPPPHDALGAPHESERGPTEDEVREALSFAAVRARECGASSYGTAGTDVVFERDGHVRSVEVHAVGLPPALRACVADAVRQVRVPPFERETIHVRYPIRL